MISLKKKIYHIKKNNIQKKREILFKSLQYKYITNRKKGIKTNSIFNLSTKSYSLILKRLNISKIQLDKNTLRTLTLTEQSHQNALAKLITEYDSL